MQELLDRGIKAVPVTISGDEVVIGFNPKELARVFGLNPEVAQVDLPTMVDKYQTVLVAACRAARQIPPERAEWESPERQRTIRQFTFHLVDRPERALNAYHVRRYTNEDRGREVDHVIGPAGFEEIARYGEGVLEQVKSALTSGSDLDLGRVLDTYMGNKTAGELFDLALGHSVHHLKQLYEYMSLMDIEPVDPLGQEDFEGIAVPTELF
jgi:uncharacterized damage-inducible protein DinB